MAQTIPDEAVREMHRALKDFGYPVDFSYCRKAVDDLIAGEPVAGGPKMFIQTWLQEAKLLPET
ncbi:hypothetical protein LCGC14_2657030 [marine sediment metagenome]|uniref:Uncharacterized protein n=1 Tax=marine sediment metagenome TaxID=412755 RepID=A0A0F9C3G1_9ZZZZ